jgi:hypothetical protein
MASNSIEVTVWGPGFIGEHSGDSPYFAANSRPRMHHSYSVWTRVTQSLSNIDLWNCEGSMVYPLGSICSTCEIFRKIRTDSSYS